MPLGVFSRQSGPPGDGSPPPGPLPTDPSLLPGYAAAPLLNQKAALLALTICFMTSAWLCSLLRLYVRSFVQRTLGWDDFFLVSAMITTTLGSIILCIMPDYGLGDPIIFFIVGDRAGLARILKIIYVGTATYPLSFMLIKLALLFQYLRAFDGAKTRLICKWMIGINAVSGIVFCATTWFSCWPVHAFWDPNSNGESCWGFASHEHVEFMRITITQVVISVLLDVIVFMIPTWTFITQRRDEHTSSKLSIFGLLTLGFGALLCCVWRLAYVVELNPVKGFDPIWDNPTVMGLASCEVHLAAICAAIPVFWPVVRETWNRIFVTYEVTVTRGYTEFPSSKKTNDVELLESQRDHWEPYVGDETNGVGESETVVESLAGKRPRKPRDMLGHENGSNDTVTLNSRG